MSLKVRKFDSQEEWMNWRLGKLTGSAVKDTINLRDGDVKAGVWSMVAESLIGSAALAEDDLTSKQVMERGHSLEPIAIARFEKETGKHVNGELIGWEREDDSRIAISPDGVIGKTEAVEVKCLLSKKHAEALYTRRIPKNTGGYEEQMLHYFIVNRKLKTLHYVFFHPDFPAGLDFLHLQFHRKDLADDIAKYEAAEQEAVGTVRSIVNALSLYSPEEIAAATAVREELLHESAWERAGIAETISKRATKRTAA